MLFICAALLSFDPLVCLTFELCSANCRNQYLELFIVGLFLALSITIRLRIHLAWSSWSALLVVPESASLFKDPSSSQALSGAISRGLGSFLAGVAAGCWIDLCGNLIGLIGHSMPSEQPTLTLSSMRNKESMSLHAIFFTTFGHSVSSIHSSTCLLRPFHSTWRNSVSRLA